MSQTETRITEEQIATTLGMKALLITPHWSGKYPMEENLGKVVTGMDTRTQFQVIHKNPHADEPWETVAYTCLFPNKIQGFYPQDDCVFIVIDPSDVSGGGYLSGPKKEQALRELNELRV